ncbi:DEAD/DEAH box helicase [Vagococcus sp.]|uniref:DEAD/DEAH box helicase n=1 Tax=Vagococcus sp. TaxID=1933889 RepID=UPI003F968AE3
MKPKLEELYGRRLLYKDLEKLNISQEVFNYLSHSLSMVEEDEKIICVRCGTEYLKKDVKLSLPNSYYCPECLILGRVDTLSELYYYRQKKGRKHKVDFTWQGHLTKKQKKVASELVQSYRHRKNHLVHAVTGAGKTEMLFPLIQKILSEGKQVAIASPRVDVCLELYPRLQKAFQKEKIILLYGEAKEKYTYAPFVICTTHQLLRFYHAFDVIILDEVDAFPYAENVALHYGTFQAKKRQGCLFFLTATPSPRDYKFIEESQGNISCLFQRFHGFPLPVPREIWIWRLSQKINENNCPIKLLKILKKQHRHLLVFFPSIALLKKGYQLLKRLFPRKRLAFVYSSDLYREEKVLKMRMGKIDWLLTTTILERGVTFANIDVLVIQADHPVFNPSSLVQIAGRVGRSPQFPTGSVYFIHSGKSRAMKQAILQIKEMNAND